MNKEKLKRQVLHQSGEAFLATSMVAIVQHDERGFKDYGSGTCVYYRDQYLIMTAAHVLEDIPKENLTLVYSRGRSNDAVPISASYSRKDSVSRLDVGFLMLDPDVAHRLGKNFLTADSFETAPLNLATDLVALNGFPGGWFHDEGRKYIQFTSLTFITLCDETDQWHRPVNLDVQIEVGYPDVVQEVDTNQHVEMPDVEGMSGGGMWVLNINPRRLWSPEYSKLVGIITHWNESKGYVRGNRVGHWLKFVDEILDNA
jgi:hypothetical protein